MDNNLNPKNQADISPDQDIIGNVYQYVGPIMMLAGGILLIVGMVSFFSAYSTDGQAKHLWCAIIGLPMLITGGIIAKIGLISKYAQYTSEDSET